MEYARSDFLFKGPIATYSVQDLLFGFSTKIVDRLNTGAVSDGNIYYRDLIQPAYIVPQEDHQESTTVLTGEGQSSSAIA
jgi:hypothetical protein